MKRLSAILVFLLVLCTGIFAFAEDNAFVGRWNEESEMGSIILKSDGTCEGWIMLAYELKGTYTLIDSQSAILHVESLTVAEGMDQIFSGAASRAEQLQYLIDGSMFVLTDDDTLLFLDMEMERDEHYTEVFIINDGQIEGQWESEGTVGQLDGTVLYFTPEGIFYTASNGKITERPYHFDGTTAVLGDGENLFNAYYQQDGSLQIEGSGTYVKTKAYTEADFDSISGLYIKDYEGEPESHIEGYFITPDGDLLYVGFTDRAMLWETQETDLVMAGSRIGKHDKEGNRFYASVEDGELTVEEWVYDYDTWERYGETYYYLRYSADDIIKMMDLEGLSAKLPSDLPGVYVDAQNDLTITIYEDGKALLNYTEAVLKTDGNRVIIYAEANGKGNLFDMTFENDALHITYGMNEGTLVRSDMSLQDVTDYAKYTNYLELSKNEEGITVTGLTDAGKETTDITIPASIGGIPVIGIKADAFRGADLVSVTIENGVASIGSNAFAYCGALETVILPDNIVSMGEGVFLNCTSLRSVALPAGLTEIPASTFSYCAMLESVAIPEGVTSVGSDAFNYCESLEELELPSTLQEIGQYAFRSSGLRSLFIPEGVTYFHASMINDTPQLKTIYFPKSIARIEEGNAPDDYRRSYYFDTGYTAYMLDDDLAHSTGLFRVIVLDSYAGYENKGFGYELLDDGTARISAWFGMDETLVVPSQIDGITVTVIGENAFRSNTTFSSVIIEDGITSIEPYAFYETAVQTIRLPSTLKTIGEYAMGQTRISSLFIPESVESIGKAALPSNCDEVYIPASVTEMHNEAASSIDIGYVHAGTAGESFAAQKKGSRSYGCSSYIHVEPNEITQAVDGTILRHGMTTAEYNLLTATPTPAPTPEPTPTPAAPSITLPPMTLVPPEDNTLDAIPSQFCGHYHMKDRCVWSDDETFVDFWVYPDGSVYYRAECAGKVSVKHGTAVIESGEVWGQMLYDIKINYHYWEGNYVQGCDHYFRYRLNERDGKITFSGTDTACMSFGDLVDSEVPAITLVTPAPTPEPTPVPAYVVTEIPESARVKDLPDDDPAKHLLGPWHGYYYDSVYDFYFAADGIVYGSHYDTEFSVWTHYNIGQYTVQDNIVTMTWPEDVFMADNLTIVDDPNKLLLFEEPYNNHYITRVAE